MNQIIAIECRLNDHQLKQLSHPAGVTIPFQRTRSENGLLFNFIFPRLKDFPPTDRSEALKALF